MEFLENFLIRLKVTNEKIIVCIIIKETLIK